MKRFMLGCIAAVATLAFVAAPAAKADPIQVTYTTSGVFGSNNSSTVSFGANGTLSFSGIAWSNPVAIGSTVPADFGSFVVAKGQGANNAAPFSDTLTLQVSQTSPVTGQQQILGNITGTVVSMNQDDLKVTWSPSSWQILPGAWPRVAYTISDLNVAKLNVNAAGAVDVQGTVAVPVPLPAAAWSTLGLLGIVSVRRIVRRRATHA